MELNIQQFGLFLEMIGVLIIFAAQISFLVKAYAKYRKRTFLKRAILGITTVQLKPTEEELKELTDEQFNEMFQKFILSDWFYEDFTVSLFGLGLTLIGIILQF